MGISRRETSKLLLSLTIMALLSAAFSAYISSASGQPILTLTVATNKESYDIRELVIINGDVTYQGVPATDCLISIETRNPKDNSLIYRTIPIGDPSQTLPIQIQDAYLTYLNGTITDTVTLNTLVQLHATIQNTAARPYDIVITATVLDGTSVSIFSGFHAASIPIGQTKGFSWSFFVQEWAYSGKAQAFVNVYNDFPRNGGTPYALEGKHEFYITRNLELAHPHSILPETSSSQPGEYETSFRASPDRFEAVPGDYLIYATAIYAMGPPNPSYQASNSTSYNLNSYPSPPQAAFTYSPLEIYQNMTVTFDGSSSSAEGYNDTIISYEWTINDPNDPQHIVNVGNFTDPPDPTVSHVFEYSGTFTVELNVTDNEGLWSTTSKPVQILSEYDPTADFVWTPPAPIINVQVTFNASSSTPGWSAQIADYAPITDYEWNFSGIILSTNNSIIDYIFADLGNFTVTLTVTDSIGRTDSTSRIVEVQNETRRIYDVAEPYGEIDMRDVALVARAFGSQPGDENWDPRADITGPIYGVPDGEVDMRDVSLPARHFGEIY